MKMCVHFFLRQTREWFWYTLAVVVGLEPTILFYQKQQLFLFHEKRKKQFDCGISFFNALKKKVAARANPPIRLLLQSHDLLTFCNT